MSKGRCGLFGLSTKKSVMTKVKTRQYGNFMSTLAFGHVIRMRKVHVRTAHEINVLPGSINVYCDVHIYMFHFMTHMSHMMSMLSLGNVCG